MTGVLVGVHFDVLDEFLEELERQVDDPIVSVHRETVRATPVYRTGQAGIRRVTVLASFVSEHPFAAPEIVRAGQFAGDLWGHEDRDAEVEERRDALMAMIAAACERHGLTLAAGFYEAGH